MSCVVVLRALTHELEGIKLLENLVSSIPDPSRLSVSCLTYGRRGATLNYTTDLPAIPSATAESTASSAIFARPGDVDV